MRALGLGRCVGDAEPPPPATYQHAPCGPWVLETHGVCLTPTRNKPHFQNKAHVEAFNFSSLRKAPFPYDCQWLLIFGGEGLGVQGLGVRAIYLHPTPITQHTCHTTSKVKSLLRK